MSSWLEAARSRMALSVVILFGGAASLYILIKRFMYRRPEHNKQIRTAMGAAKLPEPKKEDDQEMKEALMELLKASRAKEMEEQAEAEAAAKKADEDAAAKKKAAEEGRAEKKTAEEGAAAKMKAEEEAADKKKAEEEAAAKKKAEE